MRILDRYIAKAVIGGSLTVLMIIVSMELIFSFVEESGDIDDEYTAFQALLHVGLTGPQRAYEAFPIATLIGSLMALGGMAARSELVVMRAAGMSVLNIGRSVMVAGLLLAALAAAIGEWVAPPAERASQDVEAQARGGDVSMLSRDGFWARDGRRFIRVGAAPNAHLLEDVQIYAFDESRALDHVITASRAEFQGDGWLLHGVAQSRFGGNGVAVERDDTYLWEAGLHPEVLDVVVVDPQTLSMAELWTYIGYLQRNDLESEQYELALWLKIGTPLATLTMLLLTIPLAFGALRSTGAGQRIFVGVMIGIAFYLSNRLLNHLGLVYGIPPMISALLPTLVCLAVAIYFTSRIR
ncbi:LPS export ABC transporter permease LptG [Aquisalimonas sp.]|uniref:LPS export ABC transporter permease LptG n=1 Tax=unclassified Aquisalimonas TaxID=2644645 RepID=UPI0025C66FE3|nr:LPS export ABC transporter permease LptG [Aquisalimonas sp.]